jgi:NAD(P) transhydrogenase subunit beta
MPSVLVNLAYLVASVLFILGLKGLSHPRSAVRGNLLGAVGMLIAVVVTMLDRNIISYELIIGGLLLGSLLGIVLAIKVHMTAMPQMVALLNGFGGGASVLVAGAALVEALTVGTVLTMSVKIATAASAIIGAVTFWGSLIAFAKLQEMMPGNRLCSRR